MFGAHAWLNRGASALQENEAVTVRITANEVAWLADTWVRQRQRPPTQEELRSLVTEFLKEELLAREARAMGLDENDLIVRRRLAQKLEFLVQDTSRLAEPTDEDLRRFYEAYPDRFQSPARVSFTQIYFSRERRKDAAADAKAALAELRLSPPTARDSEMGDRLLDSRNAQMPMRKPCQANSERSSHAPFSPSNPARGMARSNRATVCISSACRTPNQPNAASLRKSRRRSSTTGATSGSGRTTKSISRRLLKKYDVVVDENLKPLVGPLEVDRRVGGGSREEGSR